MKLRKLRYADWSDCVKMLDLQWNLGKKQTQAKGRICAWIYFFEILAFSDELFVCETGAEVVGLGGYGLFVCKKSLKKKFYQLGYKALFFHPYIKDRHRLKEYYDTYDYVPESLKVTGSAELSMLIARKDMRGKGVGRMLFEKVCEQLKLKGCKRLIIETDDSCRVNFYEKVGCELLEKHLIAEENRSSATMSRAYLFAKKI